MPLSGSTKYCPTFDFTRRRTGQKPRGLRNIEWRHLVRNIDNRRVRRNAQHHRLADADRVILHIEVRHEADDTRPRRGLRAQDRECEEQQHKQRAANSKCGAMK
jgi:hypothetical protein